MSYRVKKLNRGRIFNNYYFIEKRKRQRMEDTLTRRKEFHERFPPSGRFKDHRIVDMSKIIHLISQYSIESSLYL